MLRIQIGSQGYDVAVVSGDLDGIGPFITSRIAGRRALIATDTHVSKRAQTIADCLSHAGFVNRLEIIPAGEQSKCIEVAAGLWAKLADWSADRHTAVIAVGGGMVGDLAGFVAATYARGLPFVIVPTSLLAMVDSAIGGKTAINLPQGKNLVGSFHQPACVWMDTAFLESQPDRDFRSGLAEVIKMGVAFDAEFFAWLEVHIDSVLKRNPEALRYVIEKCVVLKGHIVEQDERETTGQRAGLNYGHTFGHAFEAGELFQGMSHGEAVAAGMVCAGRLAERLGLCDADVSRRQSALLARCGLPTEPPKGNVDEWIAIMRRDKKAVAGQMRFVLPRSVGSVELVNGVNDVDLRAALA